MKRLSRTSTAVWRGTGLEGKGALSTSSGALREHPYSLHTRFVSEDGKAGTNPEELIAAAHAGCFAMALSFALTGAGHPPEQLDVSALLTMETPDVSWTIRSMKLTLRAKVAGLTQDAFLQIAEKAKASCPVSQVLRCDIELDATLV